MGCLVVVGRLYCKLNWFPLWTGWELWRGGEPSGEVTFSVGLCSIRLGFVPSSEAMKNERKVQVGTEVKGVPVTFQSPMWKFPNFPAA